LARHCEKMHDGVLSQCSCKICGKQFKTTSLWGKHFRKHFEGNEKADREHNKSTNNEDDASPDSVHGNKYKILLDKLNEESSHAKELLQEKIQLLNLAEEKSQEIAAVLQQKNKDLEELKRKNKLELLEVEERKNAEVAGMEKRKMKELRELERVKNEEIAKYKQDNIQNLRKEVQTLRSLLQKASMNELHAKITQIHPQISTDVNLQTQHKNLQNLYREWQQITHRSDSFSYLENLILKQKNILLHIHEYQESKNQENRSCLVCWEKERAMACVPCGHVIYCGPCSSAMVGVACALCRKNVTQLIKIYM